MLSINKTFKIIVRNSFTYGSINILTKLTNYLLVPFHTLYISPANYGIITEIYSIMAILSIFFACGMESTFFRFIHNDDQTTKKITTILIYLTVFFSLISFFILRQLHAFQNLPIRYVLYTIAILSIDNIALIPFDELRVINDLKKFFQLKLIQVLINVLLNIVLIINFKNISPVEIVLISNLISNFCGLLFLNIKTTNNIPIKIIKDYVKFSIPLLITNVSNIINIQLLRISLRYWLPKGFYDGFSINEILGIVGSNCKLATLSSLLIQSYYFAIEPIFFKNDQNINYKTLMKYYVYIMGIILIFFNIFVMYFAHIILKNPIYLKGLSLIPILSLNYFLSGIYYHISLNFKNKKKTQYGAILSLINLITTIYFMYKFIPQYGYIGGGLANTIGIIFIIFFGSLINKHI